MKTLDEVIDKLEDARVQVETGNGYWVDYRDNDDLKADALQYLKEYKKYNDTMCALPDYYEWIHSADNPALTWEQLKQMEGKPVWIEYGIGFNQKRWVVIHSFHNTRSFCYMNVSGNYPNTFWQKDMGEDEFWQAYRKER